MLGFLKKKFKKDKGTEPPDPEPDSNAKAEVPEEEKPPRKKRKFPVKWIFISLLALILVGSSGFLVYRLWFSDRPEKAPVYTQKELAHLTLPEEMVRFCFTYFPDLYQAMDQFNTQMILIEQEIQRIEEIGAAYPEQKKIADREKNTWEKAAQTLKKAFIKIEKPVKETYVLFRVNETQGLDRIKALNQDLTVEALEALKPARAMTSNLKPSEPVPQGMLKGTLFKLKKKFL